MCEAHVVGRALPRVDGEEKVRGEAVFAADVRLPGMLVARILPSPHPHAEIASIDADAAEAMPGVHAVITAADIPDVKGFDPRSRYHAFLARRYAVFAGQPVAAAAALDATTAEEALEKIRVEYRILPAVLDLEDAMRPDGPAVSREPSQTSGDEPSAGSQERSANIADRVELQNGDVEAAFAEADVIVESTHRIPRLHQGYIEPHGVVAHWNRVDHVDVWACVQSPFGARDLIIDTLGIPACSVTVHTTEIGGAFGGKDMGFVSPLAVLLAKKACRPVKLTLTRHEELTAGVPAPRVDARIKVGATKDGLLTAVAGTVWVDVGAFGVYWGSPALNVAGMILHKYRLPAFRLEAVDVFTNRVSLGAYRAPMALQAAFVIESQLDEIARRLKMDPIELRRRNIVREGDVGSGGRPVSKHGGAQVLNALAGHPMWCEPLRRAEEDGDLLRGRGMALGLWGSGSFPASAVAKLERGGLIRFIVGQVDLTGSYTSLAQIAAETLGVSVTRIVMTKADTGRAPHASVSGGSSTVYSMGGAVKEAAADLRGTILKRAAQELEVDVSRLRLSDDGVHAIDQPDKTCQLASLYRMETDIFIAKYPPFVGRGSRLSKQAAPCFAGSLAEVTVDPETGKVTVTRLVTAQDVGKAINPMSVEGQIQGGGCQSIGAGLWEEVVYGTEGRVRNADLLDYRMPTSADVPMIETILIEQPGGDGPYGAKGVGEPPIIAPAAAVANAIADAIGLRITDLPITPERIWRAMSDAGGSDGE